MFDSFIIVICRIIGITIVGICLAWAAYKDY